MRSTSLFAAFLACLALSSCAAQKTSPEPVPARPAETPEKPMEKHAYLLLSDGSFVEDEKPAGLHIRGKMDNGQFHPEGDIEGDGPLGQAGSPGWMELQSGSFFGDQTARPPFPPYVKGFMTPEGEFRPSSRKVTY